MKSKPSRKNTEDSKADTWNYTEAFAEMIRLNKQGDKVYVLKKINHSAFKVVPRPQLSLKKAPAA
ncbi:hypothetical protein [Pelagibius sp. Alg239-R121]|uniref:hypothetical protein n=1 Tax=Pelagibius sp. Alg239-R121 TaxID=2993448 RepID=UPI0024A6690E|nr:hypothetical protein [Pelagibius sp. Alg239-R121]